MSQETREKIQREALDAVLPWRKAGLHISMGVGKTFIGLQYINQVKGKALVVAPKLSIFDSWTSDALKFNLTSLLDQITFTTYISLLKHNPEDYDIVILDEAHNTKESHDGFLFEFKGRVLGLTGTPPRFIRSEKGYMMQEYYPIKYSYGVDEAVDEEILNDYRIYIHSLPLSSENDIEVSMSGGRQFNTSEVKNYSWLCTSIENARTDQEKFIKRIMQLNGLKKYRSKMNFASYIMDTVPAEEKCILFANTTEQADELCANSYHSKNHKLDNASILDDFSSGAITRLSAVEQLSEGVTIPNLKHIIIMHSYGNEKKASQKIGRALRLNKEEVARIHILSYRDTVDETWVNKSIEDFDSTKVIYVDWDCHSGKYVKQT